MNKLVYSVFKTIMFAMIFVFVFDMASYLYRALSLNQRMESIMVSMQRVVMENNYLPEDAYSVYEDMLVQLADDMNSGNGQHFIEGFTINYDHDADNCLDEIEAYRNGSNVNVLVPKMNMPASYGDIMIVQVGVTVQQPTWRFTSTDTGATSWNNSETDSSITPSTTEFGYTYYVPCLKYTSE